MSIGQGIWCIAGVLPILTIAGCAATGPRPDEAQPRAGFVRTLPNAQESARLLGKEDALAMRSGLVVLEPGQNCGCHTTEGYEEIIICLAGAGEIACEGSPAHPIAAGQYAYNPPRTWHNVFNTGSEIMRYIYVVAPTAPPQAAEHH